MNPNAPARARSPSVLIALWLVLAFAACQAFAAPYPEPRSLAVNDVAGVIDLGTRWRLATGWLRFAGTMAWKPRS